MSINMPRRNLPPDAEAWGRAVEKDLQKIKQTLGIATTNIRAVQTQASNAARLAQQASDGREAIEESLDDLWPGVVSKPPENPTHGTPWIDSKTGNAMMTWADYGPAYTNYVHNPGFYFSAQGWTVEGGSIDVADGWARVTSDGSAPVLTMREDATHQHTTGQNTVPEVGEGVVLPTAWTVSAKIRPQNITAPVRIYVVDTVTGEAITDSGQITEPGERVSALGRSITANPVRVIIEVRGLEAGETATIDEALLVPGEQLRTYIDGTMVGVEWRGDSHASPSDWNGEPRWVAVPDKNLEKKIEDANKVLEDARQHLESEMAELDDRLQDLRNNPLGLSGAPWTVSTLAPTLVDGEGKPANWVWQQINDEGKQIGFFTWNGAQWVEHSLDPTFLPVVHIGEGTAGTLDVGRLSASTAKFDEAVANKIWSEAVTAKFLTANEAIIGGAVLKDDAITARHITASEAVWTRVLGAHKIKGYELDVTSVKAWILTANSITAEMISSTALNSKTITGSTIRTRASTARGLRLDDNGFHAFSSGYGPFLHPVRGVYYDGTFAAGTRTYLLDENTGRVDMRDRLVVGGSQWLGASSPGVAIIPYGVAAGSTSTDAVGVFLNREASTGASNSAGMWIHDPVTTGKRDLIVQGYQGGGVRLLGGLSSIRLDDGGLVRDIRLTADGAIILRAPLEVRHAQLGSTTGGTMLKAESIGTDTDTGQVLWVMRRDSSSVRYKDAIEAVDGADRILDLDPKSWFDRSAAETIAEYETAVAEGQEISEDLQRRYDEASPLKRIPGLIAEDVHAAGLGLYVNYTVDPATGNRVPDGLQYDRLWTLLIPVVRKQRDKIAELESRLEALETALN